MDRDGHGYEDGCGLVIMQHPCSFATSSSFSNSEMRPRAMARAIGSQKSAIRHRMTKHDYELMISYLEGFPKCNGGIMGKKYNRYLEMYKKAHNFYLGTGAGLTDPDVAAGLTLEEKMNRLSHFFMLMHALYGSRANIDLPVVGDACLPDDGIFGVAPFCPDSQPVHTPCADAEIHELSGDEEEAVDREEDPMDFLGDAERDVFENGTAPNPKVDDIGATAADNNRGGLGSNNQTARSALDIDDEQPEILAGNARQVPSREGGNQQLGEDMRSSGRRGGRDRPPPPERKNFLISAYEDQVKEKLILRKAAQEHKISFRDPILDDRRQAREAKQLARIAETIEAERRARAYRRSILMAELVKGGKTMDDVAKAFRLLDSVEQLINTNI
ncbi:hypothetical protein R1sor_005905 [Riccia sorocarpa]|uniref:Uncharacterized protein n=1 Tax=Riccia sorocarpa TaxID=122646 RepID=A0ABD3HSF2_9MARC